MTLATSWPKPMKRSDIDAYVDRVQKARARQDRWRQSAIAKAKSKPRTAVKARNEVRIARKAKAYRTVLASPFHKQLRYDAYLRSCGFCECETCADIRERRDEAGTSEQFMTAITAIPVWFTRTGSEPAKRFRSTAGELHHRNYKHFGDANPAELQHVLWVWKECHQRIESEFGTRRQYLRGTR